MQKYIPQLTDEAVEEFFEANGYRLCKDLTDDDGLPIDAIERSDEVIFARVQQKERNEIDAQLAYYLAKKHPGFMALSMLASTRSGYGRNIDLVHFSDFYLSKFCITREDEKSSEELCTSYIQYMAQKFPTYKADFIAYCETLPDDEMEEDNTL
jgi:hypothetical protein